MAGYSILTLNCGFLPNWEILPYLGDDVFRARHIAERIIATETDFVMLNEVFHDGARVELQSMLHSAGYTVHPTIDLNPEEVHERLAAFHHDPVRGCKIREKALLWYVERQLRQQDLEPVEFQERLAHAYVECKLVGSGFLFAVRRPIRISGVSFYRWESNSGVFACVAQGFYYCKVSLPNATVPSSMQLFGLHMQPYATGGATRRAQLIQLQKAIALEDRVISPLLKLIAGDFNIIGETDEYSQTLGGGLPAYSEDLFRSLHPGDPGYTWVSGNPHTERSSDRGKNERLDYILSAKEPSRCKSTLRVEDISIEKFPIPGYPKLYASDHFGLALRFDVS